MKNNFASVEEALKEIRAGRMLIVVDDEDRENEGDFIMAAEMVTPEAVNFMAARGRGLLCQAITEERARELDLPPMAASNTSAHTTAFTVSVDARGITTTGISAGDRAATIRAVVDPSTRPEDLLRPGHIFPLVARNGGVLARQGHTEASADLSRLAGFRPSGVLCEILDDDGRMARLPRLEELAQKYGLKIVTVESLVRRRRETEERRVGDVTPPAPGVDLGSSGDASGFSARRLAESRLPTESGPFRIVLYENPGRPDQPHYALVSEKGFDPADALVRVHSECLTGETLNSRRCDCGFQLAESMRRIAAEGGVVVYLRQEGRGIGLAEKIRAYALQDMGFDTVEANIRLGHRPDERDFAAAGAVLTDLGITGVRLLTNNPDKPAALVSAGIRVHERIGIETPPTADNRGYLAVKKARFGHHLECV
jgi:3,4-dihydroxy 2-butanone 4-phosphate synthase/GTP cyclohydrolase II